MTPVILCGGYSTRMGEDKGLKKWNGKPLALAAGEIIHKNFGRVPVMSIRTEQQHDYMEIFPLIRFVLDDPALDIGGPMKGILSVHKIFPLEDLFILACDMPFISQVVIRKIKFFYSLNRLKDILICRHHDHIEPLCGIYSAKGLNKILDKFQLGNLKNHQMTHIIDSLDTLLIDISDEEYDSFVNLNSPEDYRE